MPAGVCNMLHVGLLHLYRVPPGGVLPALHPSSAASSAAPAAPAVVPQSELYSHVGSVLLRLTGQGVRWSIAKVLGPPCSRCKGPLSWGPAHMLCTHAPLRMLPESRACGPIRIKLFTVQSKPLAVL